MPLSPPRPLLWGEGFPAGADAEWWMTRSHTHPHTYAGQSAISRDLVWDLGWAVPPASGGMLCVGSPKPVLGYVGRDVGRVVGNISIKTSKQAKQACMHKLLRSVSLICALYFILHHYDTMVLWNKSKHQRWLTCPTSQPYPSFTLVAAPSTCSNLNECMDEWMNEWEWTPTRHGIEKNSKHTESR